MAVNQEFVWIYFDSVVFVDSADETSAKVNQVEFAVNCIYALPK